MKTMIPLFLLAALALPGEERPRPGYDLSAVYVPMNDGVRLAVDIALPKARRAGERFPALLLQTRYWRGPRLSDLVPEPELYDNELEFKNFFTARGYAVVMADVRGTGASFGTQPHPWSPREIEDGYGLVDWIARQPWSNERVAGMGNSYLGTTAQLLAVTAHPALKAVVPEGMEWDVFDEIAFPGGVFNEWFVRTWSAANQLADQNLVCDDPGEECALLQALVLGVRPVDADQDLALLAQAIQGHAANGDLYAAAQEVEARDQRARTSGVAVDDYSVHTMRAAIARSGVPIFGWGSWRDGATAQGVLRRFQTLDNPQRAVIGDWAHGGDSAALPRGQRWAAQADFLDAYLKQPAPGGAAAKRLDYWTLGENRWKTTSTWPPEGVRRERWHFGDQHTLMPEEPREEGADVYAVDFAASSGPENRWVTQATGAEVKYGDRAEEDRRLLTYESAPLTEAVEITGNPALELNLESTHADGAVHAYLEAVSPQGRVEYLTEGSLRLVHRKVAERAYPMAPVHSYRVADMSPFPTNQRETVRVELQPISVRVPAGSRLRVALAGHDASVFARYPATGSPVWTLRRGGASFLELPVRR